MLGGRLLCAGANEMQQIISVEIGQGVAWKMCVISTRWIITKWKLTFMQWAISCKAGV